MTVVAPAADLAPFVREYTFVETDEEATRVLVPDGAAVAGFRFGGHACLLEDGAAISMPDASFAGVRDTARRMRTSAGGGVVLARFHPGGASAFFRPALHPFFGTTVPLERLAPLDAVAETAARVAAADEHATRVAAFEGFLRGLCAPERVDALVMTAVCVIASAPSGVRVGALAEAVGLSRDRFEKRFRRTVGASPKQLASILRLRRAVEAHEDGASLTRLAAEAGFFDQPHFNRAFRAVTGTSPRAFFDAGGHC